MSIDRSRGAEIRKYGNGARCVMYLDAPGVYVDENNNPLSDEVAKQSGFNVTADRKRAARLRTQERMMEGIHQKFNEAEAALYDIPEADRQLIQLIQVPDDDRYTLADKDGNRIVDLMFTYEEAVSLWEEVTGRKFPGISTGAATVDQNDDARWWWDSYSAKDLKQMLIDNGLDVPKVISKNDMCHLAAKRFGRNPPPEGSGATTSDE